MQKKLVAIGLAVILASASVAGERPDLELPTSKSKPVLSTQSDKDVAILERDASSSGGDLLLGLFAILLLALLSGRGGSSEMPDYPR